MLAAQKVSVLCNFRLFIIRNIFEGVINTFFLYYAVVDYRYFGLGLKEQFYPTLRSKLALRMEGL